MEAMTDPSIRIYAFRYALGRMTYAVDDVVNMLINEWEDVSKNDRRLIKDSIRIAIKEHKAGMGMDVRDWEKILELED